MCRMCNRIFCNGNACCIASCYGAGGAVTGAAEGIAATLCFWVPPVVENGMINPGATLARNIGAGAGVGFGALWCAAFTTCVILD